MQSPDPSLQVVAPALLPLRAGDEAQPCSALASLCCSSGFGICSGCSAGFVSMPRREAVLGPMNTHLSPAREGLPRLQSIRSKIELGHQPLSLLPRGGERQLAAPAPPEQDRAESWSRARGFCRLCALGFRLEPKINYVAYAGHKNSNSYFNILVKTQ